MSRLPTLPDGYALSTNQPAYQPSRVPPANDGDRRFADPTKQIVPPQTMATIGDTLTARGVTWAWYAGAWNDAVKDGMQPAGAPRKVIATSANGAPCFVTHHQPFNYFARFAPGTADRERHLRDYTDLVAGIEQGTLPQVAFYKPQGTLNEHPGYANVLSGDQHIADLLAKIKASPLWMSTAIIVTYDENGGFWDHVAPPAGDRWGPATRIPTVILSPHAKRGYVDHTSYDTTSILKFITLRFGLAPPLARCAPGAGDLPAAFRIVGRIRRGRLLPRLLPNAALPQSRTAYGCWAPSACAWTSRRSSFIPLPLLGYGAGRQRLRDRHHRRWPSAALIVKLFSGVISIFPQAQALSFSAGLAAVSKLRSRSRRHWAGSSRTLRGSRRQGIRGSPRDALIADITPAEARAAVSDCARHWTPLAPLAGH